VQVGFVLRYTRFYQTIRDLVQSGALGRVLSGEASEVLAYGHTSSTFMRGHYRLRSDSGSFILTKCSHDFDILSWILGRKTVRVASFGGLDYFTPRPGVGPLCSQCTVADRCLFDGRKLFRERYRAGDELTDSCVFLTEKDIVDNQVALLEYEGGLRLTFSVHTLGARGRRTLMLVGDAGELSAELERGRIEVRRLGTGDVEVYTVGEDEAGHQGGDARLVEDFLGQLRSGRASPLADVRSGCEAVLVGYAVDVAMRERRIVDIDEWRRRL